MKAFVPTFVLALTMIGGIICSEISRRPLDDDLSLPPESPEVIVGDRLFFETRFSQYFFEHHNGDVNASLTEGDPIVNDVPVMGKIALPGPFRGQSMNCRTCHLGDDFITQQPLAQRTYCDFSRRSALPQRKDGLTHAVRNSPIMINLGLPRDVPVVLHYDGEFTNEEDLVIDTMTGRNFGWLPQENAIAIAHIAKVIREDSGVNPRNVRDAAGVGIPYRLAMLGTDLGLPRSLQIPIHYRIDVQSASDQQVVKTVANLIEAYMNSLRFGTTNTRRESGSPYDLFLIKNQLPTEPKKGESNLEYAPRLLALIEQRSRFEWVTSKDDQFKLHKQSYEFGSAELEGLKIFFTRSGKKKQAHVGNCIACHTPPQFTDYRFHNNGASQSEYDAIFGEGAFASLEVPDLKTRNANFDLYLPASPQHANASGRFRSVPIAGKAGYADLGVWNIFANSDLPKPQAALTSILCEPVGKNSRNCTPEKILPLTIASFKTPSIRDLGHSYPYFHSGALDSIEDMLHHYISTSTLARSSKLRNAAPELSDIQIDSTDIPSLTAFLKSLNEDYH